MLLLALRRLPRVDGAPDDADGSWAALALAGPIGTVLFYGQVDLWLLGLLVLAAAAVSARDGGGAALGLSVLTKPPAVLAGLFSWPPALESARRGRRRGGFRLRAVRAAGRGRGARERGRRMARSRRAEHPGVGDRAEPAGLPHPRARRGRLARDPAHATDAGARPALGGALLRRAGARAARGPRRRVPDDLPLHRAVLAAGLACELRPRAARGAQGRLGGAGGDGSRVSSWRWSSSPPSSPPGCSSTGPRPSGSSPSGPGGCSGSCSWSSSSRRPVRRRPCAAPARLGRTPGPGAPRWTTSSP